MNFCYLFQNNYFMFRFYIFSLLLFVSFSEWVFASQRISNKELAKDLSGLMTSRASIESLSGTWRTYTAFSRQYLQNLEWFFQKYATPFHTLALRPTVDRALSYRLRIQQYSLSCEITALQIILSRLWIQVSEDDIFWSIQKYSFPYSSGWIWWDPDMEFVWLYNGKQKTRTGYGIYAPPLAKYAQMYSLDTESIDSSNYTEDFDSDSHLEYLLSSLSKNNTHILLWWDYCTDPIFEDGVMKSWGNSIFEFFPLPARNSCITTYDKRIMNWITPEGKKVIWLSWEHAFVLLGYIGTTKNPTHIIVWDTFTGRHVYPYFEWMRKWLAMQNRSLIISSKR